MNRIKVSIRVHDDTTSHFFQEALQFEINGLKEETGSVLSFAIIETILVCLALNFSIWWFARARA
jgi:hypothetical protein